MPIVPSSRTEYSKSVFGFGVVLEIATGVSQPNSDAVSIVSSKSIGMIFFMMCHLSKKAILFPVWDSHTMSEK